MVLFIDHQADRAICIDEKRPSGQRPLEVRGNQSAPDQKVPLGICQTLEYLKGWLDFACHPQNGIHDLDEFFFIRAIRKPMAT
jgi:hypothetical protein